MTTSHSNTTEYLTATIEVEDTPVYENKHYAVVKTKEEIYPAGYPEAPLAYGVVNKSTEKVEAFCPLLPSAIMTANSCSEQMELLLPETPELSLV